MLSILEQSCFSFERMQAPGFCLGLLPGLKKIYGDQKEEISDAMKNNMDFINTEPHMATFLQGLVLSLEENGQDRALIKSIKTGLFGLWPDWETQYSGSPCFQYQQPSAVPLQAAGLYWVLSFISLSGF